MTDKDKFIGAKEITLNDAFYDSGYLYDVIEDLVIMLEKEKYQDVINNTTTKL